MRGSDLDVRFDVLRDRVTMRREKRVNDHEQRGEYFHGRERMRRGVNPP